MRRVKKTGTGLGAAALILVVVAGCGEEPIDFMKDFVENRPPAVSAFTSDLDPAAEVVPNMKVNLAIEARDPEGDSIHCGFTSDTGTFRRLAESATGCTIEYFIGDDCPSSESIIVRAAVSDGKGAATNVEIDLGDGRAMPSMAVVWNSKSLAPLTSTTVGLTPDGSGFCQGQVRTAPDDTVAFNPALTSVVCEKNVARNLTMYAGDSGSNINLSSAPGTYWVYIILYDHFGRQYKTAETVTVTP